MKKGSVKPKKKQKKVVSVNLDNTNYPSVPRNVKRMGWKITESTSSNLLFWYDNNVSVEVCMALKPYQFINHFPGTYCISRKIELYRYYSRAQKLFPDLYTYHPLSFTIPTQQAELKAALSSSGNKRKTFIIKPDLGAQGNGIFLIQDPDRVEEQCTESAIAQQYISPYLLDGFKFDFRIYVLMTSVFPLRLYTFGEGMTRFCTERYRKPKPGNLDHIYGHLTNYSVNKHNENFQQGEDGSKRPLSAVFGDLASQGVDIVSLRKQIDDLLVLTVICGQPFLEHCYRSSFKTGDNKSRCFEIMGFDVMLDKNAKPWLLEVNHSPSLTCDAPFDKQLKDDLITGALKILDLSPSFKKTCVEDERARARQRITGEINSQLSEHLFDPAREIEIAKTQTHWRLIYPSDNQDYKRALEGVQALPLADETAASTRRKEAIQKHLKQMEEPKPMKKKIIRTNTPSLLERAVKKKDPTPRDSQPPQKLPALYPAKPSIPVNQVFLGF